MNDVFNFAPLRRISNRMIAWRPCAIRLFRVLAVTMLALATGCDNPDAVRVQLDARTPPGRATLRREIRAQVTGPQTGLLYKWFSVSGQCDPQETDSPETIFTFADGVARDRVTVEVWRDKKRIAQSEIDLKFDEKQAGLAAERPSDVQIEITTIPPYGAGGADTRADIAGKVSGNIESDYRIIIYARAYDSWYVQPIAQMVHPIHPDNTWTAWTHTGSSYAALVVLSGFEPRVRLDMLPRPGGHILARTVVEGARQ